MEATDLTKLVKGMTEDEILTFASNFEREVAPLLTIDPYNRPAQVKEDHLTVFYREYEAAQARGEEAEFLSLIYVHCLEELDRREQEMLKRRRIRR